MLMSRKPEGEVVFPALPSLLSAHSQFGTPAGGLCMWRCAVLQTRFKHNKSLCFYLFSSFASVWSSAAFAVFSGLLQLSLGKLHQRHFWFQANFTSTLLSLTVLWIYNFIIKNTKVRRSFFKVFSAFKFFGFISVFLFYLSHYYILFNWIYFGIVFYQIYLSYFFSLQYKQSKRVFVVSRREKWSRLRSGLSVHPF